MPRFIITFMHKDLLIDGTEYISANRAAKKLGYTQDHIGALIRSGKVSGKMIGRSWYVDPKSLSDHKKNRKVKLTKTKSETPVVEDLIKSDIPVPQNSTFITYEREQAPIFPTLNKYAHVGVPAFTPRVESNTAFRAPSTIASVRKAPKKDLHFFRNTAVMLACIFVITSTIGLAAKNLEYISSRAHSLVADVLGSSNPTPVGTTSNFSATATNTNGIVVVADKNDHADVVAKTKNAFSDEVNVSVDADGNAGVVTPVFHPGDDTEHYTFVLVPVKAKK